MKIMKRMILLLFLSLPAVITAQKYLTKSGEITFEASVPSFEEVKATNQNVTAIINTENGEFAALALMKGFRFKVALMEEHFNENYVESESYPKAKFKGTLEDFEMDGLSKGKTMILNGEMTLHGKTKKIAPEVQLTQNGETILLATEFVLKPEDFDIKIPKMVSNKIAEEVIVKVDFEMKKK